MIRASENTGIAETARLIIKGNRVGLVPGGVVFSGSPEVFYLVVCRDCGDGVAAFKDIHQRAEWLAGHHHANAYLGVEVREARL